MARRGPAAALTGRRPREPLPDALRALALIGVLVVNGMGYRDVPGGRLLGATTPADSAAAQVVTALVASFVQGKAYPLLAFLFGMGIAYAARGLAPDVALAAAQRRAGRLLLLGVLHGTLLYFGDILTLYAACAWWVARSAREPWRRLRPRLGRALGYALASVGLSVAVVSIPVAADPSTLGLTIGNAPGYGAFLALNAPLYATGQVFALVLALPLVRLCMLLGVAAVRLRWLTSARWHGARVACLRRCGWFVLAANVAYGLAYVAGPAASARNAALESASPLWSAPLAAVYVAVAATAWQRGRRAWVAPLVPLGQHTLTVYVGASLLMLVLFSGAGFGWQPGSVAWVGCALGLWTLAWAASTALTGRWPLEAWIARR
jgi:uncharacterized protein